MNVANSTVRMCPHEKIFLHPAMGTAYGTYFTIVQIDLYERSPKSMATIPQSTPATQTNKVLLKPVQCPSICLTHAFFS